EAEHDPEGLLDDDAVPKEYQPQRSTKGQAPGTTSGGRSGSGWARGAAAGLTRRPTRYQVSISPLPLTGIVPLGSQTNSSSSNSFVSRVIWIRLVVPCDSMRLAVFSASPLWSYRNCLRPSLPAQAGHVLMSIPST